MNIDSYTVEQIKDPTGILSGLRYEFFLSLEVDEDDELYSEAGISLRVLFYRDEQDSKILNYHFQTGTGEILDFALEEDEEAEILRFCSEHNDTAE
ncbi:DUF6509 family protein [Cytobacillus gottheilii]|uniref:DUF6509 family protein n=1 Tax=Cytobacillus gottheilii TaxID=859144 RepID=UPI0009BAFF73|nr:DUF6509 family protein [Cytobacillus gottheilii]